MREMQTTSLTTNHSQMVSPSGFYNDEQYNRTYHFLKWISQEIHTNSNFSSVGMLEILNEPERTVSTDTTSMINTYYPTAWQAIRDTEKFLKVNTEDQLHIQIMVCTLTLQGK